MYPHYACIECVEESFVISFRSLVLTFISGAKIWSEKYPTIKIYHFLEIQILLFTMHRGVQDCTIFNVFSYIHIISNSI
jgi:hypothetical protein